MMTTRAMQSRNSTYHTDMMMTGMMRDDGDELP